MAFKDVKSGEREYWEECKGILSIHITKARYKVEFGKSGAICIHDRETCRNEALKITAAGVICSVRYIVIAMSTSAIILYPAFYAFIENFGLAAGEIKKIIFIEYISAFVVVLCLCFWPHIQIKQAKKDIQNVIEKAQAGTTIKGKMPGVSDMTKIIYHREYISVLEEAWKYDECFETFDDILKLFFELEHKESGIKLVDALQNTAANI